MRRRTLLGAALSGGGALALSSAARPARAANDALSKARVVVVGGGYAGATAAKALRLLSDHRLEVLLVEAEPAFVSCPLSNLVVGGLRELSALTRPYDALSARHGVQRVQDRALAIDADRKQLRLARGEPLRYDKLVLAPGVEMMFDEVQGLRDAQAQGRVLQAWKAGAETLALRRQLEAMPDGGVFVIAVPEVPFRCPPAPYERACLVAAWLQRHKPRAKVLLLDANPDIPAEGALFRRAWSELYPGLVEYRAQHKAVGVTADGRTLQFEVQDDVRADVLNVLPPMRAGALAVQAGLANSNARWCAVDFRHFASTLAPDIHVLGDAIQTASAMPKSGHMAHSHAKVAAAAIVAELAGREPDPRPRLTGTCYSFFSATEAARVATEQVYDAAERSYVTVPGAAGVSAARSTAEADAAWAWARDIWADMLG